MIRQKTFFIHFIPMFTAELCHRRKTISNFNAFDRINRHHGRRKRGIEFIKYRLAQSNGYRACNHANPRAR